MKKLLRGMLFAGAIAVLSSDGAFAGWKPENFSMSWGGSTPTTPPPAPTPPPSCCDPTCDTGGGTPAVPEPGTMLLMGSGAAVLAYARRRQALKTQGQNVQE